MTMPTVMTTAAGRRRCAPLCVAVVAALVFCAAPAPASAADPPARVRLGNGARAAAFRPGTRDLYVANWELDQLAVVSYPDPSGKGRRAKVQKRRDAYAEHFMIMPSGIAFNGDGSKFATAHEAVNWYRDKKAPTISGYMGPTLWEVAKFAAVNQDKRYKSSNWGEWFGSHIDMMHESPYAMGLAWDSSNRFYVLDGCGHKPNLVESAGKAAQPNTDDNRCNRDGHLVLYDFNDDHDYGGHFHENGVLMRFLDAPFKRVVGVVSGIVKVGEHVIYADTGNKAIRRVAVDGANSGARTVLVKSWDPEVASGAKPVMERQDGRGAMEFGDLPNFRAVLDSIDATLKPTDVGEDNVDAVEKWIAVRKNQTAMDAVAAAGAAGGFDGSFIMPRDWSHAYGVQLGAQQSVLASGLSRPSGIALDATRTPPRLYVADQPAGGPGVIIAYDYNAAGAGVLTKVGELATKATNLQGVAVSLLLPGKVFFVDAKAGSIGWVNAP